MPILNALEARAMTLNKRKAAFLCERRRADIRDQAHDALQTAGIILSFINVISKITKYKLIRRCNQERSSE